MTVRLRKTSARRWIGRLATLALAGVLLTGPVWAQGAPPPPPPGSPPPVNTQDHPDALILNVKNPLAVHAGPGKPNVGVVYIPPSLFGKAKDKGQKAGQTEQTVMGATPK